MGACFHDAGPGSNAKTSVHRNAVKPTGRLRRAAADVARETFRSTCSPTCAEKSTGTNKSSPQEQAGNDFPEFSQSRTKLRQRLLTLPPRRPNDRSPTRTPAGDLRSGRAPGTGWAGVWRQSGEPRRTPVDGKSNFSSPLAAAQPLSILSWPEALSASGSRHACLSALGRNAFRPLLSGTVRSAAR